MNKVLTNEGTTKGMERMASSRIRLIFGWGLSLLLAALLIGVSAMGKFTT